MIFNSPLTAPPKGWHRLFSHPKWGEIAYQYSDKNREASLSIKIVPKWLPLKVDFCATQSWGNNTSSYQEIDQISGRRSHWTLEGRSVHFQRFSATQKIEEHFFEIPQRLSCIIVTPITLFDLINSNTQNQADSLGVLLLGKSELFPVWLDYDAVESKKSNETLWQIRVEHPRLNQWTKLLMKQSWFLKSSQDNSLSKILVDWGIYKVEWAAVAD